MGGWQIDASPEARPPQGGCPGGDWEACPEGVGRLGERRNGVRTPAWALCWVPLSPTCQQFGPQFPREYRRVCSQIRGSPSWSHRPAGAGAEGLEPRNPCAFTEPGGEQHTAGAASSARPWVALGGTQGGLLSAPGRGKGTLAEGGHRRGQEPKWPLGEWWEPGVWAGAGVR